MPPSPFDPDAAAQPGTGLFGLPFTEDQADIVILPVPFAATTSYGGNTAAAPEAILAASMQVDLFDHQFGPVYERGIFLRAMPKSIADLSARARRLAKPIIDRGGATKKDSAAVKQVNAAGDKVNTFTFDAAREILAAGKIPGLLGGDHSTPFGFIRACADHASVSKGGGKGLGILQIDAHMDLRDAYEGFAWSHASIMHNVLERIPQVSRLVQVGIRDYGAGERDYAESQLRAGRRVVTFYDLDLARQLEDGAKWSALCRDIIEPLPRDVYISFDIDGLEPALCPHTGTPVGGGLSFNRACLLLEALARSGRRIVGFDLNEVSPGPDPDQPEWDANIGARILYKLCGAAATAN